MALLLTLVGLLAFGAAPLISASDTGAAPSATAAFVAGDTTRYVARVATGKEGQFVRLNYTITEARPGNTTTTYRIVKIVRSPHTDVVRCKQVCSGYLTATIWDKQQRARYVGHGRVTVQVWKS